MAVRAAGTCAFCGGTGLTKGHVWPAWLGRFLPMTGATHHEQEIGRFYSFDPKVPGPAYSKRLLQGPARSRRPRNTCLACNTGWMSTIENGAMPYMAPLIQDTPLLLDTFGQRQLAALLVLMAMRLEFLTPSASYSSPSAIGCGAITGQPRTGKSGLDTMAAPAAMKTGRESVTRSSNPSRRTKSEGITAICT
jgi:hypothetical protein